MGVGGGGVIILICGWSWGVIAKIYIYLSYCTPTSNLFRPADWPTPIWRRGWQVGSILYFGRAGSATSITAPPKKTHFVFLTVAAQAPCHDDDVPNVTLQCFEHYITFFQDLIVFLYFQVMDDYKVQDVEQDDIKLRLDIPRRRRRPFTMTKSRTNRVLSTTDDFGYSPNPTQMLQQLRPNRRLTPAPLFIPAAVIPIPEQRRPVDFMELNYMLHRVHPQEGSPLLRDWHSEVRGAAAARTAEEAAAPVSTQQNQVPPAAAPQGPRTRSCRSLRQSSDQQCGFWNPGCRTHCA